MSNENYLNYYIETMTSTLTDVIVRNVSLQATNRLHEDTIKEYEKTVEALDAEIGRLNQSGSDQVKQLELEVARLNDELNTINIDETVYYNSSSREERDNKTSDGLKDKEEVDKDTNYKNESKNNK